MSQQHLRPTLPLRPEDARYPQRMEELLRREGELLRGALEVRCREERPEHEGVRQEEVLREEEDSRFHPEVERPEAVEAREKCKMCVCSVLTSRRCCNNGLVCQTKKTICFTPHGLFFVLTSPRTKGSLASLYLSSSRDLERCFRWKRRSPRFPN